MVGIFSKRYDGFTCGPREIFFRQSNPIKKILIKTSKSTALIKHQLIKKESCAQSLVLWICQDKKKRENRWVGNGRCWVVTEPSPVFLSFFFSGASSKKQLQTSNNPFSSPYIYSISTPMCFSRLLRPGIWNLHPLHFLPFFPLNYKNFPLISVF